MEKLYIVMPAYNEEGAIAKVVEEWHAVLDSIGHGSKVVIFNDGSKDKTSDVLERMKIKYPNLIVINKNNTGHGPTCTAAYKYAIAEGADWIFQTDADGQTKSDDFRGFWEKRDNFDFIIGWRSKRQDGVTKLFISRTLKLAVFMIFGIILKDANAPFRLMKANRLRQYLRAIPDNYFLPNTLLSVMVTKNNEKIFWQEISFAPRTSGISSMPFLKVAGSGINLVSQLYKMRSVKLSK